MSRLPDQAQGLRQWACQMQKSQDHPFRDAPLKKAPRAFAIAGGKGGVGKTMLTANLAVALGACSLKILAVDADLGLANLDLAFGVRPTFTVGDVLHERCGILEALMPVDKQVQLLAAASGRFDLAQLSAHARLGLIDRLDALDGLFDVLLLDVGSGIGQNAVHFAGAAQAAIVVVTPEPTSIADAYAFIKVLRAQTGQKEVLFVANMVHKKAEGERLYVQMAHLVSRFLDVDLRFLGSIVMDCSARLACRMGQPVLVAHPDADISHDIMAMATRLTRLDSPIAAGNRLFWRQALAFGQPPEPAPWRRPWGFERAS